MKQPIKQPTKQQPKAKNSNGLEGHFFHSVNQDGKIEWQGEVITKIGTEHYLVQLFSWLDGSITNEKLVETKTMTNWLFYPDNESMLQGYWPTLKNAQPTQQHQTPFLKNP